MNAPNQHSDYSSTKSLLLGVILGAVVSFAGQFYSDYAQDKRTARQDRSQQVERLMNASSNIRSCEMRAVANWVNLIVQAQTGTTPDFNSLFPDMAPVNELRTVTALYLPEVEPESKRVVQDYSEFCMYVSEMVNTAGQKHLQGAPIKLNLDKARTDRIEKSINELQEKLISLAKQTKA